MIRAASRLVAAAFVVAVAAAFAAGSGAPSSAQALRKLHVTALSMRADRTRVRVGGIFHLAIHVHVRENVTALDELVIPDVGTMQLLGDERAVSHGGGGTDDVETLTLEAVKSGPFTFRPAYLDAIDANTGRPSRFSSNAVRVDVVPPAAEASRTYGRFAEIAIEALLALLAVVAVFLGVRAAVRLRQARARSTTDVAPPQPRAAPVPAPARSPREEVADALRAYRAAPDEPALRRLRAALFAAAGSNGGATLNDALRTTSDRELRAALVAAERAAFGPPAQRAAASQQLVSAAQGWLA
ncbi:MAG TPA: hypothetical protein VFB22_12575 [Candidatus Baltobacteraceae bacterium]|nr:hypothetical protein [Candidatus Baltobacteraceae bacterium]